VTRLASLTLALLFAVSLGCAHYPVNPPLVRWEPDRQVRRSPNQRRDDLFVVLAFSGGGTRAAAFSYGVLEELRDTWVTIGGQSRRLLDEVDLVSGVSGGSFTAAYYGLHGDGIFEDFEARFLERNVQRALLRALLNPVNWVRLFSPFFSRSDLAAEYYDRRIFDGATFESLSNGPGATVIINTTDMVRGSRFSFTQAELDFLCADLGPIPIARAVAASSAVPGPFTPVVLRSYAGTCGFEPPAWIEETLRDRGTSRRRLRQAELLRSYLEPSHRHVYLLDGGIADNLGVRFSFERTVEEGGIHEILDYKGIANVRQILMIVVNAETEQELPEERSGLIATGIAGMIRIVSGIQIRSSNFETIELVRTSFEGWASELTQSRGHPVHFGLVDLYFEAHPDPAERAFLRNLPTNFALRTEEVARLRAAGRELLRRSPMLREVLEEIAELPN